MEHIMFRTFRKKQKVTIKMLMIGAMEFHIYDEPVS
jgi:hypothetical protein